ncbi:MAG: hypothetical protein EOM65_04885 [Synergistales bacterium]|nr:hypothetical protein [Synergistales bacterium]
MTRKVSKEIGDSKLVSLMQGGKVWKVRTLDAECPEVYIDAMDDVRWGDDTIKFVLVRTFCGENIFLNKDNVVSITEMSLTTFVEDATKWGRKNKKGCESLIITTRYAIPVGDVLSLDDGEYWWSGMKALPMEVVMNGVKYPALSCI